MSGHAFEISLEGIHISTLGTHIFTEVVYFYKKSGLFFRESGKVQGCNPALLRKNSTKLLYFS